MDDKLKAKAIGILDGLARDAGLERAGLGLIHERLSGEIARIKERRSSSWGRGGTGKLYLSVGRYGDTVTYQERKDGSFRPDLPDLIRRRVARYLTAADQMRRRHLAEAEARAWLSTKGLRSHVRATHEYAGGEYRPAVKLSLRLSLDQMEKLLPALREEGIL